MRDFDPALSIVFPDTLVKANGSVRPHDPVTATIGGTLAGGGLGYLSAKEQADATRDAANRSSDAMVQAAQIGADASKFRPYNVYGGAGSGTFDGQNAYANLSPEYKSLRDQYLNYGRNSAAGLNTYDPNATAQDIYSKLRGLSAYQRDQDQAGLFNTLAAKGITGLSNGQGQNPYARAFFDSQNNADLQREVGSYTLGQQLADDQLARSLKATTGAAGIDQLPEEFLNLGGAFGGRQAAAGAAGGQLLSNAANAGAGLQFKAATNAADTNAAFWNSMIPGLSQGIQKGAQGLFGNSPYGYNPNANYYGQDLSQPDYSGGFY